jgi:hypothetical protein
MTSPPAVQTKEQRLQELAVEFLCCKAILEFGEGMHPSALKYQGVEARMRRIVTEIENVLQFGVGFH